MDLDSHLADTRLKQKYVATMFDILAPGYDSFTKIFSFGMDATWKARLIQEGSRRAPACPRVLDLACGTGDLGTELAGRTGASVALGLDLSPVMLSEAVRRGSPLRLAACNMLNLCVADKSFDMVSIGYGIRNTGDIHGSLREIARVLRPGGILLNLDFYQPVNKLWREIFLQYLWHSGRLSGWLWHREPLVYSYIAESIRRFVTIPEFDGALAVNGFKTEWRASHLGGAIGLHVAGRV